MAAAALLGALEWWMVGEGYFIYHRFWHPGLTASIFFGYFLFVWRVAAGAVFIPLWMDTHGMALALGLRSDAALGVIAGLWEYQANWSGDAWQDGRTVSVVLHGLVYCPPATIVAVALLRHRWVWAVAAVVALFAAEGAAWSYGLLAYQGWGVGLSLIRWVTVVGGTVLYAAWMRRRLQ
jgi:hypothetical protein